MVWSTTTVVEEFLAEAGEFLRAEPARNSVVLTVTEDLRVKAACAQPLVAGPRPDGPHGPGRRHDPGRPLFGWWRPDAGQDLVAGAFLHTPEFPVFLTHLSRPAATELAAELDTAGRMVPGVNAEEESAAAFTSAWRRRTGAHAEVHRRMRLFRLGALAWPGPRPEGSARRAAPLDRDLLIEWLDAFAGEVGDP